MSNVYAQFLSLIPSNPLLVGTITAIADGVAVVELPDGGTLTARGPGDVDDVVFVRAGLIEGAAPDLAVIEIDV